MPASRRLPSMSRFSEKHLRRLCEDNVINERELRIALWLKAQLTAELLEEAHLNLGRNLFDEALVSDSRAECKRSRHDFPEDRGPNDPGFEPPDMNGNVGTSMCLRCGEVTRDRVYGEKSGKKLYVKGYHDSNRIQYPEGGYPNAMDWFIALLFRRQLRLYEEIQRRIEDLPVLDLENVHELRPGGAA